MKFEVPASAGTWCCRDEAKVGTLLVGKAAIASVYCDAKLGYARALAGKRDYESTLMELLAIVQTHRQCGDDIARRTM